MSRAHQVVGESQKAVVVTVEHRVEHEWHYLDNGLLGWVSTGLVQGY